MNINVGSTFHDGYDKINAKWRIVKKLPNKKWVCKITNREFTNVKQIYDEGIIRMLMKWSKRKMVTHCKNCGELSGGNTYCYECEFEII